MAGPDPPAPPGARHRPSRGNPHRQGDEAGPAPRDRAARARASAGARELRRPRRRVRLHAGRVRRLRPRGPAVPALPHNDPSGPSSVAGAPGSAPPARSGDRPAPRSSRRVSASGTGPTATAVTGCTVDPLPGGKRCRVRGARRRRPERGRPTSSRPRRAQPGANAILLAGGSAFGLAAADGVVPPSSGGAGSAFATPAGPVPLVAGAVVFDLALGDARARPGPEAGLRRRAGRRGRAARERARSASGWGAPSASCSARRMDEGRLRFRSDAPRPATESSPPSPPSTPSARCSPRTDRSSPASALDGGLPANRRAPGGASPLAARAGESTTLVCVLTDAALTKTAGLARRSRGRSAGVARAVDPAGTAVDGERRSASRPGRRSPTRSSSARSPRTSSPQRSGTGFRTATGIGGCPPAAAHDGR